MSTPTKLDTAVRGLVMLSVTGGAIWGAMQFPPIRQRVATWRAAWEKGTLFKRPNDGLAEAREKGGDAPPFSPQSAMSSGGFQPQRETGDGRLEAEGATSAPPFSNHENPRSVPAPLRPTAAGDAPQPLVPPQRPLPATPHAAEQAYGDSLYGARQTGFRRDDPVASPVSPAAEPSPAELDAQLRRLDASYCLLERWGNNPPRYRFHCRVTLAPGVEPRRFEAAGSDPLQLIRDVADQVAAWRARRGN